MRYVVAMTRRVLPSLTRECKSALSVVKHHLLLPAADGPWPGIGNPYGSRTTSLAGLRR